MVASFSRPSPNRHVADSRCVLPTTEIITFGIKVFTPGVHKRIKDYSGGGRCTKALTIPELRSYPIAALCLVNRRAKHEMPAAQAPTQIRVTLLLLVCRSHGVIVLVLSATAKA